MHYVPFGSQDVLDLRIIFPSGKAFEKGNGVAGVVSSMLQEGTTSFTGFQLAQKLDEYGSFIDYSSGFETTTLRLTTLGKHMGAIMPVFREVALEPTFPEGELEKLLERQKQGLEVDEQKTAYIARREFNRLLFGSNHPYGRPVFREDLDGIQRYQLEAFHKSRYDLSAAVIVAAGGVDENRLKQLLEQNFGEVSLDNGYRGLETELLSGENATETGMNGMHYFERSDSMQATLRVGHVAFRRNHPDYHPMQVVNTILGGYFGSRLMRNIREEKGYTYGIGSGWVSMRNSGIFIIQTDVGNQYIRPTLSETKKELNLLIEKGTSQEELDIVKNYMVGKSVSAREMPSQVSESLTSAVINGLDFSVLDQKFDRIMSVTTADVKRLAEQNMQPEQLLEVVSGKLEAEVTV